MTRKIIQITGTAGAETAYPLAALCNDGTAWRYSTVSARWAQLPPIPQASYVVPDPDSLGVDE